MSDTTIVTPAVVAPVRGGHHEAWKAQPAFVPEAKINVVGLNMWKQGSPGHRFYEEVLSKNPATIQECIDKAAALSEPFNAKQVMAHLRWFYTWSAGPLEVDGVRFAAPEAPEVKAAPAKKPEKAFKKSKRAEAA
jgi:hypothetical protein